MTLENIANIDLLIDELVEVERRDSMACLGYPDAITSSYYEDYTAEGFESAQRHALLLIQIITKHILSDHSIVRIGICKCGHDKKFHQKDTDGDDICWFAQDCACHDYTPANDYVEIEVGAKFCEELIILPEGMTEHSEVIRARRAGYAQAQIDAVDDGWVKEKKDGGEK